MCSTKGIHKWAKKNGRINENAKGHTRENAAFNINLCVNFVKPFIFTGVYKESKLGWSAKVKV